MARSNRSQALDVVVGMRGPRVGAALGLVVVEPLAEHGRDVLERGDHHVDSAAEDDLGRPRGGRIGRIRHGELGPALAVERKDGRLDEEAAREPTDQAIGGEKLRQLDARAAPEAGHLVGKVTNRNFSRLENRAKSYFAIDRPFAPRFSGRGRGCRVFLK
jgi:hypothetical protein